MAGLVPAIHVFAKRIENKTWMPGTRPGMTKLYKKIPAGCSPREFLIVIGRRMSYFKTIAVNG
jgi:hypothetical protein